MSEATCSTVGCGRRHHARGLCGLHYRQAGPHARLTPMERFEAKIEHSSGDCWTWTSARSADGYGQFSAGSKTQLAHRWAYETLVGPIPHGLTLDHLCRNRACVNPAHLDPVPQRVNMLRGMAPVAIVHRRNRCKRGHELTEDNVQRDGRNPQWRKCRECKRLRERAAA